MSDLSVFSDEVRRFQRSGYRPVTTEEERELEASRMGGRPWLYADEEWPCCENCGEPMQLFLQLNLREIPEAEQERWGSEGLLQLFYCTSSEPLCEVECAAYSPFARSIVARRVESTEVPSNGDAAGPKEMFRERNIVAWEVMEDLPNEDELWNVLEAEPTEEDEEIFYDSEVPRVGDKLGGWPAWVQGVEYPTCPECGGRMEMVYQIDSEDNLPYMFGDVGAGHLTMCPKHPGVLTFAWACG